MAALGSVRVWQALTLVGAIAAVCARRHPSPIEPAKLGVAASVTRAKPAAAPSVRVDWAPAVPAEDRLLARLARAETGSEECDVLSLIPASENEAATYAITDVLERTRFASVRACAAEALVKQPTAPAQSWLIDLATDDDPNVHRPALAALCGREDAARSTVAEAAHSEHETVRENAVIALLEAKDRSAFSAATELLADAERLETLSALVEALGKSHDARARPVLENLVAHADPDTHIAAIAALGELGEKKAAPLLESLLVLGSRNEFDAAAQALVALDPELGARQLELAEHSPRAERRQLAFSLFVSSKLEGADEALANALRDDDVDLRRTALAQIASKPDAALEPDLIRLAGDSDLRIRRMATRALARLHTPNALAALEKLDDGSPDAAYVAAEIERAAPTEAERRALRIRHLEQGRSGALSLGELARDPDPAAQEAVLRHFSGGPREADELMRVLSVAPASTVEDLARTIDPADAQQRFALVESLSERADPRFADRLRAAMHDDDERVQRAALQGLAKLGDSAAQSWFSASTNSPDSSERQDAVNQLSQLTSREAAPLLTAFSADADPGVATTALTALAQLEPARAAELARQRFQQASPDAQVSFVEMASNLEPRLARPLLDLALKNPDDSVAQAAVSALSFQQGPESAARLLELLRNESRGSDLRTAAADALLTLGGPLVAQNRALLESLRSPPGEVASISCGSSTW